MRFPLSFQYDADCGPEGYRTCQAAIYDADGACIVEEPGDGARWHDLEEIVEIVNAYWRPKLDGGEGQG